MRRFVQLTLGAITALSLGQVAHGQCEPEDFEAFTPGTVATNLIPGVTFETTGSCGSGSPITEIYELIGNPDGPTNVVSPRDGCPDFSPDHLRMVFDENQSQVSFRVGADLGGGGFPILVRWFNEFGTVLGTRLYETASGMGLLVEIETGAAIIRRIEVGNTADAFEFIDDLQFGTDETPPLVEIDSPAFNDCFCGDSNVPIVGSVSDPDGTYGCDVASYRSINADPGDPWIEINQACGAFTGTLHTWNTTGVPEGQYYLRIVGTNECGLSQTDVTVVRVDRSFHTLNLVAFDEPICGATTIKGGASDHCGLTWVLEYRPSGGGAWTEIASGSSAVSCEIADWDTTTVSDGSYSLRFSAVDGCGHTAQVTRTVDVDNSSGCGCGPDLNGDGSIDVTDLLILLSNWG